MIGPFLLRDAVQRANRGRLQFGQQADIETRELIWLREILARRYPGESLGSLTRLQALTLIEQMAKNGDVDDVWPELLARRYFQPDEWEDAE